VTNIRNVNSPHWRAWMKPENRCLVPVTSFCEPTDAADPVTGKKVWTWFSLSDDEPRGGTAQYIASNGIPAPSVIVWVVICVELVGGFAVLFGFKTRWAAGVLAAWCVS